MNEPETARRLLSDGATGIITSTKLLVTDPDTLPGSLVYTVGATTPANDTLKKPGVDLTTGSTFTQDDIELQGHAIEARLYAEDPTSGFLPQTGTIARWAPARLPA